MMEDYIQSLLYKNITKTEVRDRTFRTHRVIRGEAIARLMRHRWGQGEFELKFKTKQQKKRSK